MPTVKNILSFGFENTIEYSLCDKKLVDFTPYCFNFDLGNSSRSQMYTKIGVLKTFASFYSKAPVLEYLLITLHTFRPASLLKEDSNGGVFL